MTRRSGGAAPDGRFVYLTEVDISIDSGPGINEREFVSSLLRREEQDVVCVIPEPSRPDVFHDDRIRYVPAHNRSALGYVRYLLGSYWTTKTLLREERVAALVFRPEGTPLLPYWLARSTDVPLILKKLGLYSIFGDEVTRSAFKNAVSKSMLPMYRSVIQSALAADVESPTYVEWVHEQFGIDRSRVRVMPNGVNTRVFTPDAEDGGAAEPDVSEFDAVIGYVGSLSGIRRLDVLLRAFSRLEDPMNIGLVLIGGGAHADALRAEAAALGVGHRVRFIGKIPYTDVPGWMRQFDVAVDTTAVQMRTRSGVRLASFSQKIGQYLAAGVPVLTWQSDDTAFLDEENVGRTAPYPEEEALGRKLQELVDLVNEGSEMRARARAAALRRFDSRRLADSRVAWWKELVTGTAAELNQPPAGGSTGS